MITKATLVNMYNKKKKSVKEIAKELGYSEKGIRYWMNKHNIACRTRSEAMYVKYNPDGDPFIFKKPKTLTEAELFGLGLGLYWGEGTKSDTGAVRLGNTDPALIKKFIEFLEKFYNLERDKFKFGLQIFSDMNPNEARRIWSEKLGIKNNQFNKVIITKSGKVGNYKRKTEHGVLTIYFSNTKLRKHLGKKLEKINSL